MAADGLYRLPGETDGELDGLHLPHRLAGCREALADPGPARPGQASPPHRALACWVAAQPRVAAAWRPIRSRRLMSERDREQFEAQKHVRSSFSVFSCGVAEWRVLVSTANVSVVDHLFQVSRHFESRRIEMRCQTNLVAKNTTRFWCRVLKFKPRMPKIVGRPYQTL